MARKSKDRKAAKELDLSVATRGVWLIKVPNYLSEAWKNSKQTDIGVMKINVSGNNPKAQLQFDLSSDVAKEMAVKSVGEGEGGPLSEGSSSSLIEIPRQHKVNLQTFGDQSMYLFSESEEGQLAAEGKVVHKADVQPHQNSQYLRLKKKQMADAQEPKHQVEQIRNVVLPTITPVSSHKSEREAIKKRKEEGKRARLDREVVLDHLFTAFEAHQFYTFQELVKKTQQPPAYLKEILRDICKYNTKNPHKNMYELKPEYRHYKKPTSSGDY